MTRLPGEGLPELRDLVARTVEKLPFSNPEFSLDVGLSPSYDALFASEWTQIEEGSVLETVLKKGRCILTGQGGGGKTQMLHRVMRAASRADVIVILIDLKAWTKRDYGAWDDWTASDVGVGASFLLDRFAQPSVDALDLDYLPPSTKKLLIVDGLNEIIAPVGQKILLALDQFAGEQIGLSILIADRLTRRHLTSPSRWALMTPLPLSKEVIVKYCGDDALKQPGADSLGTPYFLDAAIRKEEVAESPSETHRKFLRDHGGLQEAELELVAAAAFRLYQEASTRTFSKNLLAEQIGEELTTRMVNNRIVVSVDQSDDAQFAHHLLHDYLASRHVAKLSPDAWSRKLLQTISFDGASFDTISMVLAQLHEDAADAFLRSLYDWNPYAAAYALTGAGEMDLGPSVEMQVIIFAMLAEKRFDIVEPTRQRASDALSIIQAKTAQQLKAARTLQELLEFIGKIRSEKSWFNEWATLFVSVQRGNIADDDIERIRQPDSIYGWTVANVARRVQLTAEQLRRVRTWLNDESPVVRWRIAHVLGGHPSSENAKALSKLLSKDNDPDVKYGAVRSLVELAARATDGQICRMVKSFLVDAAPALAPQKKVKEELRRAMLIVPDQAPSSWWEVVAAVSKSGYLAEVDSGERDAWRRYIDAASARYERISGA